MSDAEYVISNTAGCEPQSPPATSWRRGISVGTALLGVVAFFLPWVQLSCGPVTLNISGFEIATGKMEQEPNAAGTRANKRASKAAAQSKAGEEHKVPVLWIVPLGCALLALFSLKGTRRAVTFAIAILPAIYLAFCGITWENQLSDPGLTAGIISHKWLLGYWASWVGLLGPFIAGGRGSPRLAPEPAAPSNAQRFEAPSPPTVQPPALPIQPLAISSELPSINRPSAQPDSGIYTYSAPGQPFCPECGRLPAIFYCTTHRRGLCLECVGGHDSPSECVYVPAFRASKGNVEPGTTSGPERPPGKRKPGDVFGLS